MLVAQLFRFVVDSAWVFWLGGLTFYMAIVVPIGSEVVGADTQGVITSSVTNTINVASIIAGVLMAVHGWIDKRAAVFYASLFVLATSGVLVLLRLMMLQRMESDGALAATGIAGWVSSWSFYNLHRLYLWVTTIQWFAALVVTWQLSASSDFVMDRLGRPHQHQGQ